MRTPKENFLRLMRKDDSTWVGDPWSCFNQSPPFRCVIFDALTNTLGMPPPGAMHVKNAWGITMDWPKGHPGATPYITKENKVVKDITHWRDYVNFPQIDNINWDSFRPVVDNLDRENLLVMGGSFMGMFEFSHMTMGFEDALCAYLEEPNDMYDMLSAYADWKIAAITQTIDHLKPDIIHSHDDWGTKRALFMDPGVWREMIKPHYQRFYDYIHSRGVLVQHHCDCVAHEVVEDMVDVGINMWQGVIPQNDIKGIFERTQGKLCLMGGIDMALVDSPDAPEEVIRGEVRRAIDTYMPMGPFIPCVANIIPIYPRTETILNDELNTYGKIYMEKHSG